MTFKTVEFIFDFGSPNAYFALKVLPQIAGRYGAEVKLTPCLLGGIFKLTGNQAPWMAFSGIKNKLAYDRLEIERFVSRHRLSKFRLNPNFPVNTLLLMRGMIAARHLRVESPYVEAMLVAMWEDGKKLDDPAVFSEVLNDAGLDGEAILAKTAESAIKDELAANTQQAVDRGTFGIPTFYVGDEMFFGKERLGQIEELLAASNLPLSHESPAELRLADVEEGAGL